MDYYNVSLHGLFFMNCFFFLKMVFVDFASQFFSLKYCGLLQYFPILFLFCYSVSPHVFFLIIFVDFFFNIELVENSDLTFPACFFFHLFLLFFQKLSSFFCVFFFRIFFVDFIFLIWSWLKIQFCSIFSLKHCGLLQCFPHGFFFFFMIFFFCRIVFVDFIFFILNWLRIQLRSFFLKNTVDCYSVPPQDFFLL